jgi:hypothetical protein
MNVELQEAAEALDAVLKSIREDLPKILDNRSAARRVRSGLTDIKKIGKVLRRLSLEHDKAAKAAMS